MRPRVFFAALFAALAAARLCHVNILWAEEDLPLAAAVQMLHGKALYRDVWFDKPPLVPAVYLLWVAQTGWLLRLAGALYIFAACVLLWRFARDMWGEREGFLAAGLLGFFLTFGIPAAVLPLAADLLMLVPHIAAVYLAWRGRPLAAGAAAGVAFLFNAKSLFVLAACALWVFPYLPRLALGFVLPNAAALIWLAAAGALAPYYQEVWRLGALYAANTFVAHPVREGISRTLNWAGFQAALIIGAAWMWARDQKSDRWRLVGWAALSLAAVAAGWRFFPRYYLQLLPVMALCGARGIVLLGRRRAGIALALLLIPFVRFGPRYAVLARDLIAGRPHEWRDVAMDRDSRAATQLVLARAKPGNTLFVWGYRPDLYAYTRMSAASRFLESQPLTGVFADRHLTESHPLAPEWTRRNREELARTRPAFIIDGLTPYNPALSIESYPELRHWFAQYREVARTASSVTYAAR